GVLARGPVEEGIQLLAPGATAEFGALDERLRAILTARRQPAKEEQKAEIVKLIRERDYLAAVVRLPKEGREEDDELLGEEAAAKAVTAVLDAVGHSKAHAQILIAQSQAAQLPSLDPIIPPAEVALSIAQTKARLWLGNLIQTAILIVLFVAIGVGLYQEKFV